jgi:hypothetical protein
MSEAGIGERTTSKKTKVVLLAGHVKEADRSGHHDYLAGCRLLGDLLARVADVEALVIEEGWPDDASVLDDAAAVVIYDGGGGKQAFLREPSRIDTLQRLMDRGAGIVVLHQAIGFPAAFCEQAKGWLGGVYVPGLSRRGHWPSRHERFPEYAVTRGVEPWSITDGWLSSIRFVEDMRGVTPLVWSGSTHAGSAQGGDDDIVAWIYERPTGGRAFCFSGIDAHSAWSHRGLRTLVANGVLWSAGLAVPANGSPSDIDAAALASYLTPRRSRLTKLVSSLGKLVRKALRREKRAW